MVIFFFFGFYCEGEMEIFMVIFNLLDFFVQIMGLNVMINWYYVDFIVGMCIFIGSGSFSIIYMVIFLQVLGVIDFCFEVEVMNCNNKMGIFFVCILVDFELVCGMIVGCFLGVFMNLIFVDFNLAYFIYEICLGNDVIICQDV